MAAPDASIKEASGDRSIWSCAIVRPPQLYTSVAEWNSFLAVLSCAASFGWSLPQQNSAPMTFVSFFKLLIWHTLAVELTYSDSWVIGLMWSLAEMDVALFCSCLPALKPLISCSFARAKGSSGGVPSAGLRAERVKAKRYDGETLTGSESSGTSKDDMTHYSKKDDGFSEDMELTKSVRHVAEPEKAQFRRESSIGQNKGRADNSGLTLGTDGIRVQKTFEVVAKEMV